MPYALVDGRRFPFDCHLADLVVFTGFHRVVTDFYWTLNWVFLRLEWIWFLDFPHRLRRQWPFDLATKIERKRTLVAVVVVVVVVVVAVIVVAIGMNDSIVSRPSESPNDAGRTINSPGPPTDLVATDADRTRGPPADFYRLSLSLSLSLSLFLLTFSFRVPDRLDGVTLVLSRLRSARLKSPFLGTVHVFTVLSRHQMDCKGFLPGFT